jgi:hypothetical protein
MIIKIGFKQLNTDLTGYALVLLNNCCSAFSLHFAKYLNKNDNLSPLGNFRYYILLFKNWSIITV